MSRNKQQQQPAPPPKLPPPKPRKDGVGVKQHWSQRIQETVLSAVPDESLNIILKGGADNGLFCYVGEVKHDKITYHSGKLHQDEIVLEVQGQKIAGYTLRDASYWLKQVSQNGAPVMVKSVRTGTYNINHTQDDIRPPYQSIYTPMCVCITIYVVICLFCPPIILVC
jgi:hypothetical protein